MSSSPVGAIRECSCLNDGGLNWSLDHRPYTSNTSGIPHLPRPFFAEFDHEPAGTTKIFVGTQGRGVWRIACGCPRADAGGPYSTARGHGRHRSTRAALEPIQTVSRSTYAWDLDNDGAVRRRAPACTANVRHASARTASSSSG